MTAIGVADAGASEAGPVGSLTDDTLKRGLRRKDDVSSDGAVAGGFEGAGDDDAASGGVGGFDDIGLASLSV
ncbi:MAG: hypothetical protein Q8M02_05425 [Candidatus Didemnitutus sp.]|nr:hypothetical protein [Candidatus Didemnitutus sp.]